MTARTSEATRPRRTASPSVAQTGWAARQPTRPESAACHDCGTPLGDCLGCGAVRCLSCEPYLSEDCRWMI